MPQEVPFKASLPLSSGKIRAIFGYRINLSRLASETCCGSHWLPETARIVSNLPTVDTQRFWEATFSQTPGALTVRPMRTTPSCGAQKASAESWHPMLSRNFGPASESASSAGVNDFRPVQANHDAVPSASVRRHSLLALSPATAGSDSKPPPSC